MLMYVPTRDGQPLTQGGKIIAESDDTKARLFLSLMPDVVISEREVDLADTTSWVDGWFDRHRTWKEANA